MYQTDDNLHHQGIGMTTVKQTTKQQDHNNAIQKSVIFFPRMADVALWLGPYMSTSSKTPICTGTKGVRKCRQITTNQTTQRPARRPANPPARLAFRQEKQQTRHTKGAGAQTKTPTKKICQRTQWFDHCITFKNMRK